MTKAQHVSISAIYWDYGSNWISWKGSHSCVCSMHETHSIQIFQSVTVKTERSMAKDFIWNEIWFEPTRCFVGIVQKWTNKKGVLLEADSIVASASYLVHLQILNILQTIRFVPRIHYKCTPPCLYLKVTKKSKGDRFLTRKFLILLIIDRLTDSSPETYCENSGGFKLIILHTPQIPHFSRWISPSTGNCSTCLSRATYLSPCNRFVELQYSRRQKHPFLGTWLLKRKLRSTKRRNFSITRRSDTISTQNEVCI